MKSGICAMDLRSLLESKLKSVPIYIVNLLLVFFHCSCFDLIQYSPYDSDVDQRHYNSSEAAALSNDLIQESDTFKFVLLSDIHNNYDDLYDAIKSINKHLDIMFTVCCGDITNSGLSQQYEWYVEIICKSKVPFFNVIGNHDYLSNGRTVFEKLFGPPNFSFISKNYKFILFDDIVWENNNRSPEFGWLKKELTYKGYRNIVITHIPPWSELMNGVNNRAYNKVVNPKNAILCLYGHNHSFTESEYYGIHTLVSESIEKREYYIINLIGDASFIESIRY